MSKTLEIRAACENDLADILALWKRFMLEEEDAAPDADMEANCVNWTGRLRRQIERGHVFIAVQDRAVVGFVGATDRAESTWVPQGVLYIVDMYIQPEARVSSAAGQLLQALSDMAVSKGYAELWTNTHVRNRRVQMLLERKGFVSLNDFHIPGLIDHLYYHKTVLSSGALCKTED